MGDLSSLKKIESGQEVVRPFSAYNLKKNDTVKSTDKTPFLFRPIPPLSTPYIREKLVGASMAWNQLVQNGNFADTNTWNCNGYSLSVSNNVGTFTVTTGSKYIRNDVVLPKAHKFLFGISASSSDAAKMWIRAFNNNESDGIYILGAIGNKQIVFTTTDDRTSIDLRFLKSDNSALDTGDVVQVENVYIIDLTLAFGTAIADRIYSMEQAQAGSGIAWIKSYGFLTNGYYANGSGIQSVCADRKEIVGFNQWDEELQTGFYSSGDGSYGNANDRLCSKNPTKVIGNKTYYFEVTSAGAVRYYDPDMNYISGKDIAAGGDSFTTPSNCAFIHINIGSAYGTTYNHDICINISDTAKNGTYEPYHKTTISLGHDELRGVMQLDADNNLVYYGDEKTSDGVVDRKFGTLNLDEQTWTYDGNGVFYTTNNDIKTTTTNMVCSVKYTPTGVSVANMPDKSIKIADSHKLYIKDTVYSDATTFAASLTGQTLVYELATPTTEASTPFTSPQYLFDGGTEEFIDYGVEQQTRDVAVPVGHVTEYMGASDGTEIKDKFYLPTLPDNDGEYNLKCRIQNGVLAEAKWDNENLIDDTTKVEYKLGINNGLLYIEEV